MRFIRNGVFFTWFSSYVLVLVISIILNLYAYTQIEKNMFEQNNKYGVELLTNKKQSIDNLCSLVYNTAVDIAANESVQEIALNASEPDEQRYNVFDLKNKLSQFKNKNTNFEDLYIYFHEIDHVVGFNSINDATLYYDVYFNDRNIKKSEWLSLMRESHHSQYVDFSKVGEEKGQGNVLYLYSIYGVERFRPYATIAIEINYLNIVVEKTDDELQKDFFILDENNSLFLTQRASDTKDISAALIEHGIKTGISDLGENITISLPAEYNNWKYVYLIEKNVFRKNINYTRIALIITNLVCALIVFCLAWVLSKKNYRPVENIAETLGISKHKNKEVNELQYINQTIIDILADNKKLDKISKIQDVVIRDAVLVKLLHNIPLSAESDEILKSLNIVFSYDCFLFTLFYIETNDRMFFDDKNEDPNEAYQLAKLVISNVLTDMLGESFITYYCDIEGMLGCIVNLQSDADYKGFLMQLEKLRQFTLENFNVEFMAGVSRLHKAKSELHLCYSEAMDCMEYRFFGLKDIIQYEDVERPEISRYYFPSSKEDYFIGFLRAGDYNGCTTILNEIFEKNADSVKSVKLIKCLLYEVCAAMMKAVTDSMGESGDNDVESLIKLMSNIGSAGITFSDMRTEMYNILESFCEKNDNATRMAAVIESVRIFIDNNYTNPDLSAGFIADKFNITSSYLSVMFKKHTQTGLLEYITSVRLKRSKEILDTTDFTIEKVAEMVGYTNSRSFFRMFLKYVGVSPGKYRANSLL